MIQEPEQPHAGRMDDLASGVPLVAKLFLLAGLAGGLFLAIVLSYTNPDRQIAGLAISIGVGIVGALLVTIRKKRKQHDSG